MSLTRDLLTAMAAGPAALQSRLTTAVGSADSGSSGPQSRRLTVLEQLLSMPVLPRVRTNALAVLRAWPGTTVTAGVRDRYRALGTRLVVPTTDGGRFVLQYNPTTLLLQSASDTIAQGGVTVATCTRRVVDVQPADTTPAG